MSSSQPLDARPRPLSPQWWVRDSEGSLAVAQLPNPALALWLVTVVVGWTGLLHGARSATLTQVGRGALLAWALDEVVRGASPVRRLIGAAVAVYVAVTLFG